MNRPMIYLASKSPRRKELLRQIGVSFSVIDVEVNEDQEPGETPGAMASRLAKKKACAGWGLMPQEKTLVLGGDTLVEIDGEVFGKPVDSNHAEIMLSRLAGRTHSVYSAVAITNGECTYVEMNQSTVEFDNLSLSRIKKYVASGESEGRAGGYAIQGAGAMFIKNIAGSYSGIMGLPLFETGQLLSKFSVELDI